MVSNVELRKRLYVVSSYFDALSWQRVKAHVGNRYNEEVDDLARAQAQSF
jgi:ribonuclease HI